MYGRRENDEKKITAFNSLIIKDILLFYFVIHQ